MELPTIITTAILEILGMPDLNWKSARKYKSQLDALRTQMYHLSEDFSQDIMTESAYPSAYLAFNFPLNFMKTRYVMNRVITLFPNLFANSKIRVLDIGCGEGAGLMGILYSISRSRRAIYHGFDASRSMIKQGRSLIRIITRQNPLPRIRMEQKNAANGLLKLKERYDLIILSNSLIEISSHMPGTLRYIERISKHLTENGILIIIEPALVSASRCIMELRDHLMAKQKLNILLPCLHNHPCPLYGLRQGKEWCHQSIPWNPPQYMHIINKNLNREIKMLKFSYIILSPQNYQTPHGYTVISPLLREKGKKKCYLCTDQGRIELVRLKKNRSSNNKDFDRISKGDIISVQGGERPRLGYTNITTDTRIRIFTNARLP